MILKTSLVRSGIFQIVLGALTCFVPAVVFGDVITYQFSGTVLGGGSSFGITADAGDTVTGTFAFDTDATDPDATANAAEYNMVVPSGYTYQINGGSIDSSDYRLVVLNDDFGFGDFVNIERTGVNVNGSFESSAQMNLYFGDSSATALDGTAVPTSLNLGDYDEAFGEFGSIVWQVDQLSQVPEPGSLLVLASGLLAFSLSRRRVA